MEKNVGDFDAYLRISGGLYLLGAGVIKASNAMVLLGAMKIAEGITRFCPLLHILNLSTIALDQGLSMKNMEAADTAAENQV